MPLLKFLRSYMLNYLACCVSLFNIANFAGLVVVLLYSRSLIQENNFILNNYNFTEVVFFYPGIISLFLAAMLSTLGGLEKMYIEIFTSLKLVLLIIVASYIFTVLINVLFSFFGGKLLLTTTEEILIYPALFGYLLSFIVLFFKRKKLFCKAG